MENYKKKTKKFSKFEKKILITPIIKYKIENERLIAYEYEYQET